MKKRIGIISSVVAIVMLMTNLTAFAAIVNGNAEPYSKQVYGVAGGATYANYLIDFDGDGSDEHFIIKSYYDYDSNTYDFDFQLWNGENKIAEATYEQASGYAGNFIEGIICEKKNEPNRKYLMLKGSIYQTDDYVFYTVVNGKWVQTDKWHTEYARGGNFDLYVNGVAMYSDDFYNMVNEYTPVYSLNQRHGELNLHTDMIEIGKSMYLSDWAEKEVLSAVEHGILPSSLADPEYRAIITREDFANLAVSITEKITKKTLALAPSGTFSDCSDTGVLKAYKAGIVNGVSEKEFDPNGVLSREQLATMLQRAVAYIEKQTKKTVFKETGDLSAYTDGNQVSDWAKESVALLNANGIMKGTSETELSPKQLCTVEQSIILAYRVFKNISGVNDVAYKEKEISSAYIRADIYDGCDAVALFIDSPKEWKSVVGITEWLGEGSNEELLVIPRECGSLVEKYEVEFGQLSNGEYGYIKKECVYSEKSYEGYALIIDEIKPEGVPHTMIVVTSPDGESAEYVISYFGGERTYDFERFYY